MLLPDGAPVKHRDFTVRRVARTTSTQDQARRAAARGEADRLCIVAAEQTAGRGRQGRAWVAPPGTALLCSVFVRCRADRLPGVPFAAGVAVADAVGSLTTLSPRLKWPNDVLAGGRKLAGVLVEVEGGRDSQDRLAVIIGLGLNRTVPVFREGAVAVSLHELVADPPALDALLQAWLVALDERLEQLKHAGVATTLDEWRRRAAGLGDSVVAEAGGRTVEGIAEDVDSSGALLVRGADGAVHRLVAGDVHLRRR
jgi:BirA family transcriptional regulator, biotin operon repressor / biotin---[acetyl-CoA-carboxylase] ligase